VFQLFLCHPWLAAGLTILHFILHGTECFSSSPVIPGLLQVWPFYILFYMGLSASALPLSSLACCRARRLCALPRQTLITACACSSHHCALPHQTLLCSSALPCQTLIKCACASHLFAYQALYIRHCLQGEQCYLATTIGTSLIVSITAHFHTKGPYFYIRATFSVC